MTGTPQGDRRAAARRRHRAQHADPYRPSLPIPFDHVTGRPLRGRSGKNPPTSTAEDHSDPAPSQRPARSPGGPGRAGGPGRTVRTRTPLTRDTLPAEAFLDPGDDAAAALVDLWEQGRAEARAYAARLRAVAPFHRDRDVSSPDHDAVQEADIAVSVALRMTTQQAASLILDGHAATTAFPRTLARLEAGEMPSEWFRRMLRATRQLTPDACALIDDRVSQWQLCSIPVSRFRRELRLLITWVTSSSQGHPTSPEDARDVALVDVDSAEGTATMQVVGPIPEMLSLGHRLDAAARSLQQAQRHALELGAEIPFDSEGRVAATGRPLSLAQLRYAALARTVIETGGVEVGADRFRMNVTVPALTLLGASDAPGMIEGTHPIPAPMARELAAGEPTWYRVLTDPASGMLLPTAADAYRPTPRMVEHLRLRHPVCAAPGCTTSTRLGAEVDHIEEFDHADPAAGGRTELSNLHLLCWKHHRTKTARRIDPVRSSGHPSERTRERPPVRTTEQTPQRTTEHPSDQSSGSPAGPASPPTVHRTLWRIGPHQKAAIEDHRDMVTPEHARILIDAWEEHTARHAGPRDDPGRGADPGRGDDPGGGGAGGPDHDSAADPAADSPGSAGPPPF